VYKYQNRYIDIYRVINQYKMSNDDSLLNSNTNSYKLSNNKSNSVMDKTFNRSDKHAKQNPILVQSHRIEDVDTLNNSGSLEGVSFYQKKIHTHPYVNTNNSAVSRSNSDQLNRHNKDTEKKIISPRRSISSHEISMKLPIKPVSPDSEYHIEKQLEMSLLDSSSDDDINEIYQLVDHKHADKHKPKHEPINEPKHELKRNSSRDIKGYVDKIIKDNEMIGSMIISKGVLFDKAKTEKFGLSNSGEDSGMYHINKEIEITDNSTLLYYSSFFELNEENRSLSWDT
jgi:hypothetical protein